MEREIGEYDENIIEKETAIGFTHTATRNTHSHNAGVRASVRHGIVTEHREESRVSTALTSNKTR